MCVCCVYIDVYIYVSFVIYLHDVNIRLDEKKYNPILASAVRSYT